MIAINRNGWVAVDLDGLAATLKRRGKNFILSELLRNSLDEVGVTEVHITLRKADAPGQVVLSVEDNSPEGFRNLAESYTMFASSYKKANPDQAGRFNAGEKFVLALCSTANIVSTTGAVVFTQELGRQESAHKREKGTLFSGWIEMTDDEMAEMISYAHQLIIPPGVLVTMNGVPLPARTPFLTIPAHLPTEVSGQEGVLRRVTRATAAQVFVPLAGETPFLYELGIPVMELDGNYHVNVMQKVPLNIERDAVPPSYLRKIYTLLVNEIADTLEKEDTASGWVKEAVSSPDIERDAVWAVMETRFGEQRVAYDPSDREANRVAASKGYTVVSGGSLSKPEWDNVRKAGDLVPAGKIFPTYNPYLGDKPPEYEPEEKWTPGMLNIRDFIQKLGWKLLNKRVNVLFEKGRATDPFLANYGSATFTYNVDRIGKAHFDRSRKDPRLLELIIHELGHEYGGHLTEKFDDAMARLGAELTGLALTEPQLFQDERG